MLKGQKQLTNKVLKEKVREGEGQGDPLHKEPIATVQLTYSSENPILVDYIKEEPEEGLEPGVLQIIRCGTTTPTPCTTAFTGPVFTSNTSGLGRVNPVVSPVVLESPLGPTTFAGNPEGQAGPSTPTKWQEAYNLYLFHEETNRKARQSVLNGCITFAATQRIYMNSLQECRRLNSQGKLAFCFLKYMLDFGKFYKYISQNINK